MSPLGPTTVKRFESLAELGSAIEEARKWCEVERDLDWCGGTWRDAMEIYRGGDPLGAAARVVEAAPMAVGESWGARVPGLSVVGSSPCVGAYLAGRPDCMHHLGPAVGLGPVRVYWDSTCSSSLEPFYIARRAARLLGAIHALAAVRPVELWRIKQGYFADDERFGVILAPLPTTPWVLAHVAPALIEPCASRQVLPYQQALLWGVRPCLRSIQYVHDFQTEQFAALRDALGCTPDDIMIPAMHRPYDDGSALLAEMEARMQ